MRQKVWPPAVALAMAIGASARSEPLKVVATPLSGPAVSIDNARFTPDWKVLGQSESKDVALSMKDLASIRIFGKAAEESPKATSVLFATGESLKAEILSVDGDDLKVKNAAIGEQKIPLSSARAIVFDPDVPEDRLRALLAEGPAGTDRALLRNGDMTNISLLGIEGEKLKVRRNNKETELARDIVAAIAFDPSLIDYKRGNDFLGQILFADGGRIDARRIESAGERIKITTGFGREWSIDPAEMSELSFRNGRVAYLSDLAPTEAIAEPFGDDRVPHQNDRSAAGTPLRLRGRVYTKGIGVRSRSSLSYAVAGFQQFEAALGLDDHADVIGSVRFKVLIDKKEVFDSGEMTRATEPKPISIPLKNARELTLIVDYEKRGDVQDYADWCDARLLR